MQADDIASTLFVLCAGVVYAMDADEVFVLLYACICMLCGLAA